MEPPPAYSGDQAPPPNYPAQQTAGGKKQAVYWVYWGVLFGTLLTWVFTVSAAADDAWLKFNGATGLSFEYDCDRETGGDNETCELFTAAKAFQILATILVSLILVLVIVAAFMQAPITGKLGLAAGIALAVTSVFQLIAFSLMAAFADKLENVFVKVTPGPTLGVAVVAWLLGTAGAVVTLGLVFLRPESTKEDGPFRACVSKAGGANAEGAPAAAPAGQPGLPTVGTV